MLSKMDPREGPTIRTFTGKTFWPLDPQPADIDIDDVAHALANLCRYTGHTRHFYSVAQHSVLVAERVSAPHRLWGLLHDASEAYLGDMAGTLKVAVAELGGAYRAAEERVMRAVAVRFNLAWPQPPEVAAADRALLVTEFRDLMHVHEGDVEWLTERHGNAFPDVIHAWPPREAKAAFIALYDELRQSNG
jgi:hypothetical protein